jgi:hypothetical protein
VFWAISLPIAAILTIMMFSPLGKILKKYSSALKTLYTGILMKLTRRHERSPAENMEARKEVWRRRVEENHSSSQPSSIPSLRSDIPLSTLKPPAPTNQAQNRMLHPTGRSQVASHTSGSAVLRSSSSNVTAMPHPPYQQRIDYSNSFAPRVSWRRSSSQEFG